MINYWIRLYLNATYFEKNTNIHRTGGQVEQDLHFYQGIFFKKKHM